MSVARLLAAGVLFAMTAIGGQLAVTGCSGRSVDPGLYPASAEANSGSTTSLGSTTTMRSGPTTTSPGSTTTSHGPDGTVPPTDGSGLYPAPIPGKCGYIDKTGAWVIEPRFTYAEWFFEGLAPVQPELYGPWGYIDPTGFLVIQPRFAHAGSLLGGLAVVQEKEDGPAGCIDRTGAWVIEPRFGYLGTFSEGLAAAGVPKGGEGEYEWGYIDKTGEWVIEPRFADAGSFSDGLAMVMAEPEGGWGYIDKTGSFVDEPGGARPGNFSEGLAAVQDASGKYGYIDTTGRMVIPPRFDMASDFSEGFALVGMGGLKDSFFGGEGDGMVVLSSRTGPTPSDYESCAYIDKTGKIILEGQFDDAGSFSDGLAAVTVEGKLGFVDTSGAWAIRPQFRCWTRARFYRGLALLHLEFTTPEGNTWFHRVYIDKTGTVVWREP